MKEFADGEPETVRNKSLILVKVKMLCPFLNRVLVATVPAIAYNLLLLL